MHFNTTEMAEPQPQTEKDLKPKDLSSDTHSNSHDSADTVGPDTFIKINR